MTKALFRVPSRSPGAHEATIFKSGWSLTLPQLSGPTSSPARQDSRRASHSGDGVREHRAGDLAARPGVAAHLRRGPAPRPPYAGQPGPALAPHRAEARTELSPRGRRARPVPGGRPGNTGQGRGLGGQRTRGSLQLLPEARREGRGRRVTWRPQGPPNARGAAALGHGREGVSMPLHRRSLPTSPVATRAATNRPDHGNNDAASAAAAPSPLSPARLAACAHAYAGCAGPRPPLPHSWGLRAPRPHPLPHHRHRRQPSSLLAGLEPIARPEAIFLLRPQA